MGVLYDFLEKCAKKKRANQPSDTTVLCGGNGGRSVCHFVGFVFELRYVYVGP